MAYSGDFEKDLEKFNKMYNLSNNENPHHRLKSFLSIFQEEVNESRDIQAKLDAGSKTWRIDMADWLGDMIVYCASEMLRYQIPVGKTLNIIMDSNFSKLDTNGQPIHDERGKVMKGPNYKKPEPTIANMLETGDYNGKLI